MTDPQRERKGKKLQACLTIPFKTLWGYFNNNDNIKEIY